MDGDLGGTERATEEKALTQRLIGALQIKRVINIDDDAVDVQGQSKEDVIGALRAGGIDRVLVARLFRVEGDADEPKGGGEGGDGEAEVATPTLEELILLIEERWETLDPNRLKEATSAAKRADAAQEGSLRDQSQAIAGDNAALLALRDLLDQTAEFRRMGIREWRESGYRLLDDQIPTLLLVDRNFERENQSATAGDDLIVGILERMDRKHVYAGLLTHTAADEGREREIATEVQARLTNARPVIVIAKKRLSEGAFPEALRMVLFADELEAFRRHAILGLDAANKAATEFLSGVDRYALLASIEAARREGNYEADHAMRMASVPARKKLTGVMREDDFVANVLVRLRAAADVALYFDGAKQPAELPHMTWEERFDAREYLAQWNLPIEIGDVFRVFDMLATGKTGGADRYYILLAQACDLSVRPDGKRSNNLESLILTEIKPAVILADPNPGDADSAEPHYRDALVLTELRPAVRDPATGKFKPLKENQAEIGCLFADSDTPWRVQFASQIHVPALALDACVMDPSGQSVASSDVTTRPKTLSTAWERRFERMADEVGKLVGKFAKMEATLAEIHAKKADAEDARKHIVAALLGTKPSHRAGITARIDTRSVTIEYGIERYARVADSTAKGLLAMLAHHHARPAFDGRLFYDPENEH